MKKSLLFLIIPLLSLKLMGQLPQGISYQAVVRNANNELITNSPIGVRISIIQDTPDGTVVFQETHTLNSNSNGLISFVIGGGSLALGIFEEIEWTNGPHFITTETDPTGGTNYSIIGTNQMLSVPYALIAQKAISFSDGTATGEMLFWNGSQWVAIPPGEHDQTLRFCNGVPTWGQCPSLATVTTSAVTSITHNSAVSGGNVSSDGGNNVTARGVVWSTNVNPTIENNDGFTNDGAGTGIFTSNLDELLPLTTYYVRAYAINSVGTAYGNQLQFTTTGQIATVETSDITEITAISATGGGNVTNDGGAAVSQRGVCWSTSPNPTTNDNLTSDGTGTGTFISNLINLEPGTSYYVRAYAINSVGTAYGDQVIFATSDIPTLTTASITDITSTTALGGGNISDDGGSIITARGVVWSTSEYPTLTNNDGFTTDGGGTGGFTSNLTDLSPVTTYYVRAYATNDVGTAYGNQVSFTTIAGIPIVITSDIINITNTSATGGGNVTSDGGAMVIVRGVCWSINPNPTTSNNITNDGSGTGSYTSNLVGLTAGTTYYVRAYAINSLGTAYGEEITFTTTGP